MSCGSNAATEEHSSEDSDHTRSDSTLTDTLASTDAAVTPSENPLVEIDSEKLLAKFKKSYSLPLELDSTFIIQFDSETGDDPYNLNREEVAYLSSSISDEMPTSRADYHIKTFIELDSIKRFGDYENYQQNLDLGQTRYSHANTAGKVKISDARSIYLWSVDYATYEACPYGWGTYIFGTLFENGKPIQAVLVAEYSGGGDPPVWGKTHLYSTITKDHIKAKFVDEYGEEDYDTGEEYVQRSEKKYEYRFTSGGFEVSEK